MANVQEVVVHKANVPMMDGETIGEFTNALQKAGCEFVKKAQSISKAGYSYMVEAFGDSAVFYCSDYTDSNYTLKAGMPKYFAATYKRDKNGIFSFDKLKEVVRKTVFEPAASEKATESTVLTTKAAAPQCDAYWNEPSVFKGIV